MSSRELAREAERALVLLEGIKAVIARDADANPGHAVKLVRGILVGAVLVRLTPTVNPDEWRLEMSAASHEAAQALGLVESLAAPEGDAS